MSLAWEDVGYITGIPQGRRYRLDLGSFQLTVERIIARDTRDWFLTSDELGIREVKLQERDLHDALASALTTVRAHIGRLVSDFNKAAAIGEKEKRG